MQVAQRKLTRALFPLLTEKSKKAISVGYLRIHHLYYLGRKRHLDPLRKLHLLLLRGWIAKIESTFSHLVSKKQPVCLVATEGNSLIASILIKPNNRRGTCWSISFPKIYNKPEYNTLREIKLRLLKYSLDVKMCNINSWILKYPIDSTEELSILRELGFQPQEFITVWSPNEINLNETHSSNFNEKRFSFTWEQVNIDNSEDLWRIENSGQSLQLRSIIDRKSSDITQLSIKLTRILYLHSLKKSVAVAGIIQQNFPDDINTLKVIRNLAWDERLKYALPAIIKTITTKDKSLTIECDSKDDYLKNLFKFIGLEEINQKVLLSKSNLQRNEKKFSFKKNTSLSTMLDTLNPPNIPIPSP